MDQNQITSNSKNPSRIQNEISEINQEFKEREIAKIAKKLKLNYVDLRNFIINPDVLKTISRDESMFGKIAPFFQDGKKLKVAFCETENYRTKKILREISKKFEVEKFLCSPESLKNLQKNYQKKFYRDKLEIFAKSPANSENFQKKIQEAKKLADKLVNLKPDIALNLIHETALSLEISDIHFQPEENQILLRVRIDGALRNLSNISPKIFNGILQQIKQNADLKINTPEIPQDGKYSFPTSNHEIDVRVSVFPSNFGESVVLRFLDSKKGIVSLEHLGFSENSRKIFQKSISGANGMILVTGPTGSGKTTTLYSAIFKISSPEKKIVTLEDPIEFRFPGILQTQINVEKGLDFSEGLRALLRQDPDIILIGEIRDKKTAETAVQSALTGHLVFSTLHTNSAADAIPRLINMGVQNFVLAPALRAIVAQRLVRRICPNCRTEKKISQFEQEEINIFLRKFPHFSENFSGKIFTGAGCEKCANTGFTGRIAISEVLEISPEIQNLIFSDFSANSILNLARKNGFLTMWENGILQVFSGKTTFSELRRRVEKF